MKIQCNNGLCDRLFFMFSNLKKCRESNEQLTVVWKPNNKCNGHFLDVFKPIKDVTFTEDDSNVDFNFEPSVFNSKSFLFKDLIPKSEVNINKFKKEIPYNAVQIRRTDKILNPGKCQASGTVVTSDQEFIEFINRSEKDVFIATDCFDIQKDFKEMFGEKIFWHERIKEPWNFTLEECKTTDDPNNGFRPTSLDSVVVDIFSCINSVDFLGTNLSSVSRMIEHYRKWRKEWKKSYLKKSLI